MASKIKAVKPSPASVTEIEFKDRACRVMYKISALDDLFSFYSAVHNRMVIRGEAISGISFILGDCAEELREIIGEEKML